MAGIAFDRKRLISELEQCFFGRIGIIPLNLHAKDDIEGPEEFF